MQTEQLIQSLIEEVRQITNKAERLRSLDYGDLTWRQAPESWNILECIEHLNLYGNFYLPEIERSILISRSKPENEFHSGFLGAYFAKSMLPKNKLNKMKTFKDKNPLNKRLDKTAIDRFVEQQLRLIHLLSQAGSVSLNKVKIKTSISGLIKLKLGDTYQFLINHMLRHFRQIEKIQTTLKKTETRRNLHVL